MRALALASTALALLLAVPVPARADTIASNIGGHASDDWLALGQSITTPNGPGWNELVFRWFDQDGPTAAGNLYLYAAEFGGRPSELGDFAYTAVAAANAAGTAYVFDTSVTLAGNTQYWFYTDQELFNVYVDADAFLDPAYAGGQLVISENDVRFPYGSTSGVDAFFSLTGTMVPEPATLLLTMLGLGTLGAHLRRRRRDP